MIIELARIKPEGYRVEGEELPGILELEGSPDIQQVQPIRYHLSAMRTGRTVIVRGALQTDVALRCSRCTEFYSFSVQCPDFTCTREVQPGDESVDLTGEIRETILLGFPNYPVCRTECKGLCAQCGANLNRGPCGCKPHKDERWGALNQLQIRE
jgi:uncharacterized protein